MRAAHLFDSSSWSLLSNFQSQRLPGPRRRGRRRGRAPQPAFSGGRKFDRGHPAREERHMVQLVNGKGKLIHTHMPFKLEMEISRAQSVFPPPPPDFSGKGGGGWGSCAPVRPFPAELGARGSWPVAFGAPARLVQARIAGLQAGGRVPLSSRPETRQPRQPQERGWGFESCGTCGEEAFKGKTRETSQFLWDLYSDV